MSDCKQVTRRGTLVYFCGTHRRCEACLAKGLTETPICPTPLERTVRINPSQLQWWSERNEPSGFYLGQPRSDF